jgi:hypothetical protein
MAPRNRAPASTPATSGAGELRAALLELVKRGKNTAEPVTLGELLAVVGDE